MNKAKNESTPKDQSKETQKSNESVTLEEREAVLSASGYKKVEITPEQLDRIYKIWFTFDGVLSILNTSDIEQYHNVFCAFRPLQDEFNELFEDMPLRGTPEDPSERAKQIRAHREEVISNRPEVRHE